MHNVHAVMNNVAQCQTKTKLKYFMAGVVFYIEKYILLHKV